MLYSVVCRKRCRDGIGDGSTPVSVGSMLDDVDVGFVVLKAPVAEPIAGNDVNERSVAVTSRSPRSVAGGARVSSVRSVLSGVPVAEPIAGNDADGGSFAVRAGASRPLVSDTGSTIIPGSMDPPPGDTNGGVSPSLQIG